MRKSVCLVFAVFLLSTISGAEEIDTDLPALRSNEKTLAAWAAETGAAKLIHLEPISANTEHQIDPHGIRLFGNKRYALVPDRNGDAVLCFDVSDPENMRLLSAVSDERTKAAHYVTIGPEGRYGYTGAAGYFTIIDLTDPEDVAICGAVRAGKRFSQEIVIEAERDLAYWAATGDHTLYAVDISDKAAPRITGSIAGAGAPNYLESVAHLELHPEKPILFATSYRDHHLCSFDVTEPGVFRLLDTTGEHMISPHEIVYDRGYLYVAVMYDNDAENPRADGALAVYDVSDPASMHFVTELRMGAAPPASQYPFDMLHGLTLDPDRMLLFGASQKNNGTKCTQQNSALSVFDVRDPERPVWLESYQSCDWLEGAQQVDFRGDILFTANHDVPSIAAFRLFGTE
ncbi:MAG: LVIVD repeat-containing protein [Candidatus Hydrogenedentota bacterium]